MNMFRNITLMAIVTFGVYAFALPNNSEAQSQSVWKYEKKVSVMWDNDKQSMFYQEECTSDSGNQCTEPRGAFRTYFKIPFISK